MASSYDRQDVDSDASRDSTVLTCTSSAAAECFSRRPLRAPTLGQQRKDTARTRERENREDTGSEFVSVGSYTP